MKIYKSQNLARKTTQILRISLDSATYKISRENRRIYPQIHSQTYLHPRNL
ncbi:hypothetical protein [Helicobacter sp. 23-1045]